MAWCKQIRFNAGRSFGFGNVSKALFSLSRNRPIRLNNWRELFRLFFRLCIGYRSRRGWRSAKLNRRWRLTMWTSDLLAVHLRRHTELTTATWAANRLSDWAGWSVDCWSLCFKCISRNINRLRARRTLNDLSSLRVSNLKWLLAIRTSKNKRTQISLSRCIEDSITGITQTRNNKFLVI